MGFEFCIVGLILVLLGMFFGIGYLIVLVLGCIMIGVFWFLGKLMYLFKLLFICKGYFVIDLLEFGLVDLGLFIIDCCFCCLKGKVEMGEVLYNVGWFFCCL